MERQVHFHGYSIQRTAGVRGGTYTVWDEEKQRVDDGLGFNSVIEAQVFILRQAASLQYVENDYRQGLKVVNEMLEEYLENHPENAAYFSTLAPGRFAEAVAEEIARLRSLRVGEDYDWDDEEDERIPPRN